MALWNYNPFSSSSYRNPLSVFQSELPTWQTWPGSPLLISPSEFDLPQRNRSFESSLMKLPPREVLSDKDKYQVTLHLGDFNNNEIKVKIVDGSLVVNAEHEEQLDGDDHVYRNVKRRYILPRNVDLDKMNATIEDNGTLTVCAPKKPMEEKEVRNIEIEQLPSKKKESGESQVAQQPTTKTEEEKINTPVIQANTNK